MELNEAVTIARPSADAFEAWARIDPAARHSPAIIERTKLTDGPIGPGSRFRAWTDGRGWRWPTPSA